MFFDKQHNKRQKFGWVFILLCFAPFIQAQQLDDLVGSWYGEKQKGPQLQTWLIVRDAKGHFEMKTKVFIDDFMLMEKTEQGEWSVKSKTYSAKIMQVTDLTGSYKPQTPEGYYLDEYNIIELSADSFTYQHTGSGNEYVTQRVADDFAF